MGEGELRLGLLRSCNCFSGLPLRQLNRCLSFLGRRRLVRLPRTHPPRRTVAHAVGVVHCQLRMCVCELHVNVWKNRNKEGKFIIR